MGQASANGMVTLPASASIFSKKRNVCFVNWLGRDLNFQSLGLIWASILGLVIKKSELGQALIWLNPI